MLFEFNALENSNPRGFLKVTQLIAHLMRNQFVHVEDRGAATLLETLHRPELAKLVDAYFDVAGYRLVHRETEGWAGILPDPERLSLPRLRIDETVALPQPILLHGDVSLAGRSFPATHRLRRRDRSPDEARLHPDDRELHVIRSARAGERFERALVIYSGGFPSRPTLATITRLAAQAQVPTLHWGDMDTGGARIFRHLERHLADVDVPLRPHMMDAELLRRFGRSAQCPGPIGDMAGSAVAGLADLLTASGLTHEQEEFDPRSPITETPRRLPAAKMGTADYPSSSGVDS